MWPSNTYSTVISEEQSLEQPSADMVNLTNICLLSHHQSTTTILQAVLSICFLKYVCTSVGAFSLSMCVCVCVCMGECGVSLRNKYTSRSLMVHNS